MTLTACAKVIAKMDIMHSLDLVHELDHWEMNRWRVLPEADV
jgi:hypothetical protein